MSGDLTGLCLYIDRVLLKYPLKTSSKTTFHFYINSPQQKWVTKTEQKFLVSPRVK